MGLFRKGIAALLIVCIVATSMGFGVQAQGIAQNEWDMEQMAEQESEEVQRDQEEKGILNFLMMESDCIKTPGVQNIAVSLGQENLALERAELIYQKADDGQQFQAEAAQIADNMVKFTIEYTDDAQKGIYELVSIRYQAEGRAYKVLLSELDMDVHYGVNQETDAQPDQILMDQDVLEEVEANVVTMDENGNTVSEQSIENVLQDTQVMGHSALSRSATAYGAKKKVIVLDPGHDSTHAGARGNGCKEEEAVLKIAQYCKTELQKYAGVTVYMTRTSNACPNGGSAVTSSTCNARRVEFAVAKKASVYVSFHLNSSVSTAASGVGVYIPNNNYRPQIGEEGKGLATSIYKKLSALGLKTWAGGVLIHNSEDNTRYPDGSLADYLGVIRRSKEAGIPAVLIEHAFLSNASDVSGFLNSNAKLKKLGVADAQGIAQYYGLTLGGSTPQIDWIQSKGSKKLRISWQGVPDAVSYEVYRAQSPDEEYVKIADVSECQYDDKVKTGVTYAYKIRAKYADGETSSYSEVQSGAALLLPEIKSVVSKASGKLKVSWKASNGAEKYEVWRKEEGADKFKKVATTTESSYTDSKIKTQQNYSYKIRARGGDNNGYSSYSPVRTGWAVMKTTVRNVSSASSTSLRVRWNKVENAYRYRIQRSTSQKKGYKTIAEVKGTASSYVDKSVKEKKKYYYKVQVLNHVDGKTGASGYCSPVAGQTITGTSMVYVKSNDSKTMELKWKKDKNAYAYSIKRSTKKNGIYEKIAEIRDCKITSYLDKGVASGKRYYYVVETIVKKKGVKGYSGDSKPLSAYSLRKVNVDVIQKVNNGLQLEWQTAPGANGYEIMRSTRKTGGFTQIAKVQGKEAVSFTDQGVQKGNKYYYRIRAIREGKRPGYGSYGKVAESLTY